jgi:Kdo2-lipid IVA lauroyltransferase/acyltransferase
MKKIRYALEAILVWVLLKIFSGLSPEYASNFGGWIARTLGPYLAVSRRALKHINLSFPNYSAHEHRKIMIGMWDHLGRVFAEYPHLKNIGSNFTKIEGLEHIQSLLTQNMPMIFFGGHIGNWEVFAPAFLKQGFQMDLVYRAPNNPHVDKMLKFHRSLNGLFRTYPKSTIGMRHILEALKEKRKIGMLIDQKFNAGVEADFFGHKAMTSPVFIKLAQKHSCALVPMQITRTTSCHFIVTVHPPLDLDQSQDILLHQAHAHLESWIKAAPSQWIWLHKRWKNKHDPEQNADEAQDEF